MKLAVLTQYYPPEIGAPQARLSELASHFVRRGHVVTVLTAMPNYPTGRIYAGYQGLVRREEREGVNVIRVFIYPSQQAAFIGRLANYFSFVLSSSAIGGVLLGAADYLFVESPPLFLGFAGVWLSRLKGMRLIFNVADLWPESAVRLGVLKPGSMAFRLGVLLERFFYRRAWLVTAQSRSILASIAERFPGCPSFHLSNGVDVGRFDPDRLTGAKRAALGGNGNCVVVYAGLHGLAQGLVQVLDAAEAVGVDGGFRFVLVGGGPEKRDLMERAKQRGLSHVCFLGPVPAHEIPELLAAADVVLVALRTHIPGAVPSKLYEAMASGRPVLLVASGEAAAIVREHQAGIAVQPADVEGIVRALQTLRAAPELRRAMGDNGRRAAETDYDRATIAARFIDHLEAHL